MSVLTFTAESIRKYYDINTGKWNEDYPSDLHNVLALDISNCRISSMPWWFQRCSNLIGLNCSYNNIKMLNLKSCPKLTRLACFSNQLLALDIRSCPELDLLDCSGNNIDILDLSSSSKLVTLNCGNNKLVSLDLSPCSELYDIICRNNKLISLILRCPKLNRLSCSGNKLTSLDLSSCSKLTELSCHTNKLVSLDISPCPELRSLFCSYNKLTQINFAGCPKLREVCYDNNPILFEPYSGRLFVLANTVPIDKGHKLFYRSAIVTLSALRHYKLSKLIRHSIAKKLTTFICSKCGRTNFLPTFKPHKKISHALCMRCEKLK